MIRSLKIYLKDFSKKKLYNLHLKNNSNMSKAATIFYYFTYYKYSSRSEWSGLLL